MAMYLKTTISAVYEGGSLPLDMSPADYNDLMINAINSNSSIFKSELKKYCTTETKEFDSILIDHFI